MRVLRIGALEVLGMQLVVHTAVTQFQHMPASNAVINDGEKRTEFWPITPDGLDNIRWIA